MAKEYIEKWSMVNKLTDIENKCQKFKPFSEAEHEMYRMICETEISIGKTPAADVVKVVRCRDCVHGELCVNLAGTEYVFCELDEQRVWLPHQFCYYGERRDDNAAD